MKKILIVKINAIGDVVMALSMLYALKQEYQYTHITWVVGSVVAPLLKEIKEIDRIIIVNEEKLLLGSFFEKSSVLFKYFSQIFFKKFDKTIIAHSDKRYRLFSLFTRSTETVFFGGHQKTLPLGTRFHGYDYIELATNINNLKNNILKYPQVQFTQKSNTNSTKKVLLFPGGANNTLNEQSLRRWNIKNYSLLANKLHEHGISVAIAGSDSDQWTQEHFNKNITNYIGKTSLVNTLSLIEKYDLIITHDSGPMHLALYLVQKTTICLFGPVLSSARVPRNWPNALIPKTASLPQCAPCYNGKNFAECDSNICMDTYTVDDILTLALNNI